MGSRFRRLSGDINIFFVNWVAVIALSQTVVIIVCTISGTNKGQTLDVVARLTPNTDGNGYTAKTIEGTYIATARRLSSGGFNVTRSFSRGIEENYYADCLASLCELVSAWGREAAA